MAQMMFKDRAVNRLSADVAVAATTIYVEDASDFGDLDTPFLVMVDGDNEDAEIMMVTAVNTVTKALTVERDMLGTTDVAHKDKALVREVGVKGYITADIANVSAAETLRYRIPQCVVVAASTVLGGAITVADATVTLKKGSTAMTGGVITIANSGSGAGDIDTCTPTAGNEFNGSTDYLAIVAGGESTDAQTAGVVVEYLTV